MSKKATKEDSADNTILLFCYGTLKTGGALNYSLEDSGAQLVGAGTIMSKDFIMRDLGNYPTLQKVTPGAGSYQHGEIWVMHKDTIALTDRIEGYPNFYTRELVTVWHDDKDYKCLVYYIESTGAKAPGEDKFLWSYPVVESGMWPPKEPQEKTEKEESEEITSFRPAPGFTVERGIYITTDWSEHYGPFDTIKEACEAIPYIFSDSVDVKTLTIGFRAFRDGLNQEDLEEIEECTLAV